MIIGVDVGTSLTKAAAFDRDGRILAESSQSSRLLQYPDGRVEQDLDEVAGTVATVVAAVRRRAGPVDALALTGQGDGLWLRDGSGGAVRPAISWLDGRASELLRGWRTDGVDRELFRRTGGGLFPGSQAPLLAYLREHEPESLDHAAVAGYCVDALVHMFTGESAVDASDASLPFLDVRKRDYDERALEVCGLGEYRRLLAQPAAPHHVFHLDTRGARMLGLPEGLPVTGGPFDLPACAIGGGVRELGDGLLTVGTTLACQVLTDDPAVAPDAEPAGMMLCTPDEDRYLRAMPAMVGTAGLDWMLDLLGLTVDDLGGMLAESPPGARGVSALPFLAPSGERAPFVDPGASGQLSGVRMGTRRCDVVRAVCESIAYAARHCFEAAGLSGDLVACGGGTRSGPWRQVFADVLGTPMTVPDDPGMGARGAAMVASQALGEPADPRTWSARSHEVLPRAEFREHYDEGYARYREHLAAARTVWRSR